MGKCVDLTNLRNAIDNDHELEQELFQEYVESSSALINDLRAGLASPAGNEDWRKAAHALKGISLNLGASALGELAMAAQDAFEAAETEKSKMLSDISEEHARVLAFLRDV